MTIANLMTQTCSIIRRSSTSNKDDYGNVIPSEDSTATTCELQQRQRGEEDEELSTTSFLLVVPTGTDLDNADAVIVDGVEYEMSGNPWRVRNPLTKAVSHIEATVVRTSGAYDGGVS